MTDQVKRDEGQVWRVNEPVDTSERLEFRSEFGSSSTPSKMQNDEKNQPKNYFG